jgi:HPt (histidine-containing phosphotransfer) domain-containing protein
MTAVNESVLRSLLEDMGGDVEVVGELIQSFLEEGPKLLAEGRAAQVAGDVGEVQRAYHTLKSTAATFGAEALAARAKDVEQAARGGAMPTAAEMAAIEAMFEAAKQELVARLS